MKMCRKGIAWILALMLALSIAPSVFAAEGDGSGETATKYKVTNPEPINADGLYMNKQLKMKDDGTGTITLETYVKGEVKTETKATPTDIVLVLDVSGSMKDNNKMSELKTAVKSFISETAKSNEGLEADKQNQISIVKFAGDTKSNVGNETYWENSFMSHWENNYTQVVTDFTGGNMAGMAAAVDALKPVGATKADNGLNLAKKQMGEARENARKVVVFFTDGEPTSYQNFEKNVANGAISAAKSLKDAGTEIYSVGIFDSANPSSIEYNFNRYMNAVSSNYPEATSLDSLGTGKAGSTYYKGATDASAIAGIFAAISESITTKSFDFDEETIVQDVMSEHFVVDGAAGDIKAYTSVYKGNDTFDTPKEAKGITTVVDSQTGQVQVVGFDFDPVVDKTPVSGKKLIIEIPVKLTKEAMENYAGQTVESNNTTDQKASIIDDGVCVKKFNTPKVTLPAKAVEKKDLVIKIYGKDKTVPYNGEKQYAEGFTTSELPEGVTIKLAANAEAKAEGKDSGTYKMGLVETDFEITGAEEYQDEYNISWKVVKDGTLTIKPIEVVVKADDKTKKKGEENPEFTGTFTGFIGNDTAESLGRKATYSTEATKDSPAGKYTIRVERNIENTTNYYFSYIDGTLTVTDDAAVVPTDNNTDNTDKTAKTGDDFQIGLIAGVALLALAGAGAVLFTRRKKTN